MGDTHPTRDSERFWRTFLASGLFQALNLLGKFILLVLVSRELSLADQGLFQIFRNDLSIGMLLVGLEYYNFTAREILRRPLADAPLLIRNQLLVHLVTYIVLIPALLMVFLLQDARLWPLALTLGVLLLLDHLGQELCRLFVTLKRPVASSFLFFVRHGVWVYLLGVLHFMGAVELSIAGICAWWIAGECVAIVAGVVMLRGLDWGSIRKAPVDWTLVCAGLRVGGHFMLATAPAVLLSYGDILMLKSLGDVSDEQLGVFSFYLQIRGALTSLCEAGVLAYFQPRLVAALQRGDRTGHRANLGRALAIGLGATLLMALVAAALVYPLVAFLERPVYLQHIHAYWLVLLMPAFHCVAALMTMWLYAAHRDRAIIVAAWASLIVTFLANVALIPAWGLAGAALGTLLGLATSGAVSYAVARRIEDEHGASSP